MEKQSAKYNLCRAIAIIEDIQLMVTNNDMRLQPFICYGMKRAELAPLDADADSERGPCEEVLRAVIVHPHRALNECRSLCRRCSR